MVLKRSRNAVVEVELTRGSDGHTVLLILWLIEVNDCCVSRGSDRLSHPDQHPPPTALNFTGNSEIVT